MNIDAEAGRNTLQNIASGGKAALARALSRLEAGLEEPENAALLDAAAANAEGATIGLTGPPGVGKSSLIDALIRCERAAGRRVAVIAVDPSSKRTGGALLGDRTRMSVDPEDDGVFIRSLAARDRLGGLSDLAFPSMLLAAAAYDLVLVETVGVGQSEIEIAALADATACCLQPGSGDALQFMKAGVMETPDILLVTKADMGAPARRTAADASAAVRLSAEGDEAPEVLLVAARPSTDGGPVGVEEASEAMRRRAAGAANGPSRAERRRSQALVWAQSNIEARFGTEGWRIAAPDVRRSEDVFSASATAARKLASLLQSGRSPA